MVPIFTGSIFIPRICCLAILGVATTGEYGGCGQFPIIDLCCQEGALFSCHDFQLRNDSSRKVFIQDGLINLEAEAITG